MLVTEHLIRVIRVLHVLAWILSSISACSGFWSQGPELFLFTESKDESEVSAELLPFTGTKKDLDW